MSIEAKQGYLEPSRQLAVAAKVSRLCDIDPENFNPHLVLPAAYDAITALDPLVEPSNALQVTILSKKGGESTVRAGATEHGSINASFSSDAIDERDFGRREYRIGGHVATKRVLCGECHTSAMFFESFWGRGGANLALEDFPPSTVVIYRPGEHPYIFGVYLVQDYVKRRIKLLKYSMLMLGQNGMTLYEAPLGIPRARDKRLLYPQK